MQANDVTGKGPFYKDYERVTPKRLLDESVFYRLLITQLQNQDPLSPMSPEDFTAQLAQLTQLEEIRKLNSYMGLVSVALIGKKVSVGGKEDMKMVKGVEINLKKNNIVLDLEDGSTVNLKDVTQISQDKTTNNTEKTEKKE